MPIGMVWSWVDYGSFQLGYMSNHVLGSALLVGLLALGITLLRRWLHRNPM
ncbi:nitrate reductase [Cereibacter sphaeroides]|uniref:nitrate reductase n=1 Tax=Cereibacter sphaeroides TaxID=1063 RepID=UPI001D0E71F1|nr:nitrate reductase [Cereibacter sphaeroides]